MQRFLMLALFGLGAQMVDGSLGMAYGLTSTTFLLAANVAPATASATVHLAEVGTTLVSGAAHWKLGNTDWRAAGWLAFPGAVGAFLGAVVLTSISADIASTWIAIFLLLMGIYILARFTLAWREISFSATRIGGRMLAPLGFGAGFLDAAGGGGWGPISTPTLLATGRMQPRKVVGTVDTSEFLVALAASAGFLVALDRNEVSATLVAALLVGGVIAAPIAAWLVRAMHPRILGVAVGGVIILTNSRSLLKEFDHTADYRPFVYAMLAAVWIAAVAVVLQALRTERAFRRT